MLSAFKFCAHALGPFSLACYYYIGLDIHTYVYNQGHNALHNKDSYVSMVTMVT